MQKVSDTVHVSLVDHLSLSDYIIARRAFCNLMHGVPCVTCERMLMVAQIVCNLRRAYSIVSPNTEYHSFNARKKLLQVPLVSVCVGDSGKGRSFTILIEHSRGVDYSQMSSVINGMAGVCSGNDSPKLETVKMLLALAQSNRERECIRYAIFKASGMSATRARHQYGFDRMIEHSSHVKEAMIEVQQIRETVEDIACIEDQALLVPFGIQDETSHSSCSSSEDYDVDERDGQELYEVSPEMFDLCRKTH